ncbi:MAG: hypothetical protein JWO82_458 [Akkermansiaceae bacterium]|nr:hypothetical protein [Akkermansiaceae bacterium]
MKPLPRLFTRSLLLACSVSLAHGVEFAPARQIANVSNDASTLRASDMDHDGDLDLVALESNDKVAVVWNNDGKGGFQRGRDWQDPTGKTGLIGIADFDGDGCADLLTSVNTGTSAAPVFQIGLIRGAGDGGFVTTAPELIFSAASDSYQPALRLHDLNGDGSPDLLVPTGSWLNDGHGHFAFTAAPNGGITPVSGDGLYSLPFTAGALSYESIWADDDGDGRDEMFFRDDSGSVHCARNHGDGILTDEFTDLYLPGITSLAAAVRMPEISSSACLLARFGSEIQLYLKGPDGYRLAAVNKVGPIEHVTIGAATVQRDGGRQRILVSILDDRQPAWRTVELTLRGGTRPSINLKPLGKFGYLVSPQLADVDGDGVSDLVAATLGDTEAAPAAYSQIVWRRGSASGALQPKPRPVSDPGTHLLRGLTLAYAGDLDGDGDTDLLTTSPAAPGDPFTVTLWTNSGQGRSFQRKDIFRHGDRGEVLEIRQHPGKPASLILHTSTATNRTATTATLEIVELSFPAPGRVRQQTLLRAPKMNWSTAQLADANGDGTEDLYTTTPNSVENPSARWFRGFPGKGFKPLTTRDSGFPLLGSGPLVDVNWDGKADAWKGTYWLKNNGTFRSDVIPTPAGRTLTIGDRDFTFGTLTTAGVDFNQDGQPDYFNYLPSSNPATAPVQVLLARAITSSAIYPFDPVTFPFDEPAFPTGLPAGVAFLDLDSDGSLDAFYRSPADNTLLWRKGLGDGNFAVPAPAGPAAAYAWDQTLSADLDGDGIPDLISTTALPYSHLEWSKGQ